MQQPIIDPVDPALLEAELTDERLLRHTNKGGNLLYVTDAHSCPNVMREIGRLREHAFRLAGGGTGKSCDIDSFDIMSPPCRQLVVWSPDERAILGGYRFIAGPEMRHNADGTPRIAMAHMFGMSDTFVRDYLPYTIELGRSFVRVDYQSSRPGARALFVLDNLWDGLGALTVTHPDIRYLFGKMTMYPTYPTRCRNLLLHFLRKHFPDNDGLVYPLQPTQAGNDAELSRVLPCTDEFQNDYRILNAEIRAHGINIPPLINAYMSLSPTMRMFGTAVNDEFGDVEETAILLTISDIYESKKSRHINTFLPND